MSPFDFTLRHLANGKPEFSITVSDIARAFDGIDLSITDGCGVSLALVGRKPVGLDIEAVASRDAETWRGLLGGDGYALALRIAAVADESFDTAATRIWTLLEAGKKANSLTRLLPAYLGERGELWLAFAHNSETGEQRFLSTVVSAPNGAVAAFTLTAGGHQTSKDSSGSTQKSEATAPLTRGKDRNGEVEVQFKSILSRLSAGLSDAQLNWRSDPDSGDAEEHARRFEETFDTALEGFKGLSADCDKAELRTMQQRVYEAIQPYVAESVAFKQILEKPLGYSGDYLLMEMMFENKPSTTGLGYHFDRSFLSKPGSEAVRQRALWAAGKLAALASSRKRLKLLDLGCGPMIVERVLLEKLNGSAVVEMVGLDFDQNALDFAAARLRGATTVPTLKQVNLVSPAGIEGVRRAMSEADVSVCLGLIEYLEDSTVLALLEAIHHGSREGCVTLLANFQPNHFSRLSMEWLQDWWLTYRTERDMVRLATAAGFDERKIRVEQDKTGSIVLVELHK